MVKKVLYTVFVKNTPDLDSVLIIRAGIATRAQFSKFEAMLEPVVHSIIHQQVRFLPMVADHWRDVLDLFRKVQHELRLGRRVHLFGYSIGAKFAARLGKDMPNISSVFLLDPVDGGPPFGSRL